MTTCPNCGTPQRRPDARFCQNCGYPLRRVPESTPPATTSKSPWLLLLGALIIIFLIGGAAMAAFGPGRDVIISFLNHKNGPEATAPSPPQPSPKPPTPSIHPPTPHTPPASTPRKPLTPTSASDTSPTRTPTPTRRTLPTRTPTPHSPASSPEEQIRAVLSKYRDIKIESLTHGDTSRLDEVLAFPVIERQKRGICGLRSAGQYYQYSNRSFHIKNISFQDARHATVMARIRENRKLRQRGGGVIKDYGYEDYRAVFLLEQDVNNQWKIYCFQALDDDEPVSCKVTIPTQNPCNQ